MQSIRGDHSHGRVVMVGLLVGALALTMRAGGTQAQSPGIHIAGATNITPLQLTRGCNQIVAESANGTPVAGIAALVSPSRSVVSIWRFNNSSKLYQAAFFADQAAPADFSITGSGSNGRGLESYYVCVTQASTLLSN